MLNNLIRFFTTKKRARAITIQVWSYLRDHPEIRYKRDLPKHLWKLIAPHLSACPLCSIFKGRRHNSCKGCPLVDCSEFTSDYWMWAFRGSTRAADSIVQKVTKWKV